MPADENGDKWACEPCIRGHRSTRCEHWDRFMLRVKKPGRPLSSCPHPKNQCSCGTERVMMVRIPKASSCICAPAYSIGPDGLPIQSETSSDYSSPSAYQGQVTRNTSSYRIEKPRQRTGSIIDPQAVARGIEVDQQYSILPRASYPSNASYLQASRNDDALLADGDVGAAFMRNGNGNQQSGDQEGRRYPYVYGPTEKKDSGPPFGSQPEISLLAHEQPPSGLPQESLASIYTSQPWLLEPPNEKQPTLNPIYRRSCCSGAPKEVGYQSNTSQNDAKDKSNSELESKFTHLSDFDIIDRPTHLLSTDVNLDSKIGMGFGKEIGTRSPFSKNTTPHTFPPTQATPSHMSGPTKLALLQQDSFEFSQPVLHHIRSGSKGSATPPTDGGLIFNPVHNCNCGDTCSCLGCAAHPYNATTRHHVQDLGHILENGYEGNHLQSRPTSPDGNLDGMTDIHKMSSKMLPAVIGNSPSPVMAIPHETSSLTNERSDDLSTFVNNSSNQVINPVYSSSSYYTMEFPMDDGGMVWGCTDVSGSCQCGSDCSCIGCLTHTGHEDGPLLDFGAMPQSPTQPSDDLVKEEVDNVKTSASPSAS